MFQVTALAYIVLMNLLVITYSEAFHNETGDSSKTHAFIVAVWISLAFRAVVAVAFPVASHWMSHFGISLSAFSALVSWWR